MIAIVLVIVFGTLATTGILANAGDFVRDQYSRKRHIRK